jgi:glycosyltransferase involved in cell wall biosynthesis
VTAIVSTYKAERFMRGCLEDLEAQTIAHQMEILVVDSASPENERQIVGAFQRRHDNIVYVRTERRETLYAAWNRAVRLARAPYLTSANTDDRHAPDALEKLARALDRHPDAGVVYASSATTTVENGTLATGPIEGCFKAKKFNRRRLFWDCQPGPQPMWRRSLHDRFGLFDEKLVSAGDYEFWLRISGEVRFLHLPEVLGLFLKSPGSLLQSNAELATREAEEARARHWPPAWGPRPQYHRGLLDHLLRRSAYRRIFRQVRDRLASARPGA